MAKSWARKAADKILKHLEDDLGLDKCDNLKELTAHLEDIILEERRKDDNKKVRI